MSPGEHQGGVFVRLGLAGRVVKVSSIAAASVGADHQTKVEAVLAVAHEVTGRAALLACLVLVVAHAMG